MRSPGSLSQCPNAVVNKKRIMAHLDQKSSGNSGLSNCGLVRWWSCLSLFQQLNFELGTRNTPGTLSCDGMVGGPHDLQGQVQPKRLSEPVPRSNNSFESG